jgi:hypothetical protein
MNNLEKAVKKLFKIAKAKYGSCWRRCVRDEIYNKRDGYKTADGRRMRKFFKSHGFTILSCGMYRTVFGWKDLVIKVDNLNMGGNSGEAQAYDQLLKEVPLAKYFVCPILKRVRVGRELVLVYPKVEVANNYGYLKVNDLQENMRYIEEGMFDDLHENNVGKFCGGLITIDYNFGTDAGHDQALEISHFSNKYKKFWKKYVSTFDREVTNLKKSYAIA